MPLSDAVADDVVSTSDVSGPRQGIGLQDAQTPTAANVTRGVVGPLRPSLQPDSTPVLPATRTQFSFQYKGSTGYLRLVPEDQDALLAALSSAPALALRADVQQREAAATKHVLASTATAVASIVTTDSSKPLRPEILAEDVWPAAFATAKGAKIGRRKLQLQVNAELHLSKGEARLEGLRSLMANWRVRHGELLLLTLRKDGRLLLSRPPGKPVSAAGAISHAGNVQPAEAQGQPNGAVYLCRRQGRLLRLPHEAVAWHFMELAEAARTEAQLVRGLWVHAPSDTAERGSQLRADADPDHALVEVRDVRLCRSKGGGRCVFLEGLQDMMRLWGVAEGGLLQLQPCAIEGCGDGDGCRSGEARQQRLVLTPLRPKPQGSEADQGAQGIKSKKSRDARAILPNEGVSPRRSAAWIAKGVAVSAIEGIATGSDSDDREPPPAVASQRHSAAQGPAAAVGQLTAAAKLSCGLSPFTRLVVARDPEAPAAEVERPASSTHVTAAEEVSTSAGAALLPSLSSAPVPLKPGPLAAAVDPSIMAVVGDEGGPEAQAPAVAEAAAVAGSACEPPDSAGEPPPAHVAVMATETADAGASRTTKVDTSGGTESTEDQQMMAWERVRPPSESATSSSVPTTAAADHGALALASSLSVSAPAAELQAATAVLSSLGDVQRLRAKEPGAAPDAEAPAASQAEQQQQPLAVTDPLAEESQSLQGRPAVICAAAGASAAATRPQLQPAVVDVLDAAAAALETAEQLQLASPSEASPHSPEDSPPAGGDGQGPLVAQGSSCATGIGLLSLNDEPGQARNPGSHEASVAVPASLDVEPHAAAEPWLKVEADEAGRGLCGAALVAHAGPQLRMPPPAAAGPMHAHAGFLAVAGPGGHPPEGFSLSPAAGVDPALLLGQPPPMEELPPFAIADGLPLMPPIAADGQSALAWGQLMLGMGVHPAALDAQQQPIDADGGMAPTPWPSNARPGLEAVPLAAEQLPYTATTAAPPPQPPQYEDVGMHSVLPADSGELAEEPAEEVRRGGKPRGRPKGRGAKRRAATWGRAGDDSDDEDWCPPADADFVESERRGGGAPARKRARKHSHAAAPPRAAAAPPPAPEDNASLHGKHLPPGYRWRKYGEKVIDGRRRSYFKCTFKDCPVKLKAEWRRRDDADGGAPTDADAGPALVLWCDGEHNHAPVAASSRRGGGGVVAATMQGADLDGPERDQQQLPPPSQQQLLLLQRDQACRAQSDLPEPYSHHDQRQQHHQDHDRLGRAGRVEPAVDVGAAAVAAVERGQGLDGSGLEDGWDVDLGDHLDLGLDLDPRDFPLGVDCAVGPSAAPSGAAVGGCLYGNPVGDDAFDETLHERLRADIDELMLMHFSSGCGHDGTDCGVVRCQGGAASFAGVGCSSATDGAWSILVPERGLSGRGSRANAGHAYAAGGGGGVAGSCADGSCGGASNSLLPMACGWTDGMQGAAELLQPLAPASGLLYQPDAAGVDAIVNAMAVTGGGCGGMGPVWHPLGSAVGAFSKASELGAFRTEYASLGAFCANVE